MPSDDRLAEMRSQHQEEGKKEANAEEDIENFSITDDDDQIIKEEVVDDPFFSAEPQAFSEIESHIEIPLKK